jgi:hypothetical protein
MQKMQDHKGENMTSPMPYCRKCYSEKPRWKKFFAYLFYGHLADPRFSREFNMKCINPKQFICPKCGNIQKYSFVKRPVGF